MSRRLAALLAALTCSTAVAVAPLSAQNLVSNPGFESGLTGWTLFASPGCTTIGVTPSVSTTTSDAHSGTTAGVVTSNGCFAFLNQDIALIPGHQYVTSFWVKVTGAPTDADPAIIELDQPTNPNGGTGFNFGSGAIDWTFYTTTAPYFADSTAGPLAIGGNWHGGDILIDDVSVTDVTTTPEPSSLALLGTGLIGLVPMLRRKRMA